MSVGHRAILVDLDRLRGRVSLRSLDPVFVILNGVGLRFAVAGAELILICRRRAAAQFFSLAGFVNRVLHVGVGVRRLKRICVLIEVSRLAL